MKISYNWLKTFLTKEFSPEELDSLLTGCGLEVEDITPVHSIPGGLNGIVIGQVTNCVPHPNADKLRVCQVDLGDGHTKQIVCGAPNVATGQKVLVATVGSTVYPTTGEPFEIKKAKIRGEVSEGMICAEDELSLGESHDGILVLPAEYEVGAPASRYFPVYSDYLIEIGLTANRGDAASHLGVARDIHALTNCGIQMPQAAALNTFGPCPIAIEISDREACKRYTGLYIKNTTVKESPDWLKNFLKTIGLKPINHVVDVTNYILHGLGQPLHAFDADQIQGNQIHVRQAHASELFKTLDGVERSLKGHECMIADTTHALAIAGVFGGIDSGIQMETKNVLIESAFFDGARVRKAARAHGLNTDASFRFERGTDPEITIFAAKLAASLIIEIGGGQASEVLDVYPEQIAPALVEFNTEKSNQLIGQAISDEEVEAILTRLEIKILSKKGPIWNLEVPAYRPDVNRPADITEEILRIYGLNKIEMGTSIKSSMSYSSAEAGLKLKNKLANFLSSNGFLELASNSLTKSSYYSEEELSKAVYLKNPLSSDLDILRMNLLNNALEAAQYNINRKQSDLRMYEFGKVYFKHGEGNAIDHYAEQKQVLIAVSGRKQPESWNTGTEPIGFFQLKNLLEQLAALSGFVKTEFNYPDNQENGLLAEFSSGKRVLAQLFQLEGKKAKQFDMEKGFSYAILNWDLWVATASETSFKLKPVSIFPSVRRDLALVIDQATSYKELEKTARKSAAQLLKQVNVFDVYQGDKIGAGKKSYALSFILQDETKTLTDTEIEACMSKLISAFEKENGASVRS